MIGFSFELCTLPSIDFCCATNAMGDSKISEESAHCQGYLRSLHQGATFPLKMKFVFINWFLIGYRMTHNGVFKGVVTWKSKP